MTTASSSPTPRSRTGSRPGGKKAARQTWTEHLDWALADFSGSVAADELYDGPFCILSLVDNRTYKRLAYQVLDRAPTTKDVEAFFRRFHEAVEAGETEQARELANAASRKLDKAASAGVIHKNQAANKKSAIASQAATL